MCELDWRELLRKEAAKAREEHRAWKAKHKPRELSLEEEIEEMRKELERRESLQDGDPDP
jgi:hypothetical protein